MLTSAAREAMSTDSENKVKEILGNSSDDGRVQPWGIPMNLTNTARYHILVFCQFNTQGWV